jgi:hypothetical protein
MSMNTDTALAPVSPASETCPECAGRQDGFQIYTIRLSNGTVLAWDVELALQLCSDGRKPIRIHPVLVDEMLRVNRYWPAHLYHVDATLPGIVSVLEYTDDSQPLMCLIDGSHRAGRCRRDGLQFFAYLLTDEESLLCQRTTKVALYRALDAATQGA